MNAMNPDSSSVVGRKVIFRTRGETHGPFTRMVSTSDLGQVLKPFVALDLVDTELPIGKEGYGWHPHSGIATLTLAIEGHGGFAESTGHEGKMVAGDIEWLSAGRAVWHSGFAVPPVKGFQLWVALPPDRELKPAFSQHLSTREIPSDGPARVLLGSSGDAASPVDAPDGVNYLVVELRAGRRWIHQPPEGHLVGWIAVLDGSLLTPDPVGKGELAIFDSSDAAIAFESKSDTRFVLGTAIPHPYDLHLGRFSVHTNAEALIEGESEIVRLGDELRAKGILR